MDVAATERAEAELNRLVERQAQRTGADEQNALEAIWRASELRVLARRREKKRVLWIEHFRRLAACNLAAARDYRSRARALEKGEA